MTSTSTSVAPGLWPTFKAPVSLGMNIPNSERNHFYGTPMWDDMLSMSEASAQADFEILWFDDHFSFPDDDGSHRGQWDAFTLMAAIAARVPDVYLGPMVACTAYRNPGVIAKMTEMIDEISGGRFILGLGAGWQKDEYKQFGLRFEPRVTQFEEALEIIHGLLRNGVADVQGEYFQANEAKNLPRGPQSHGAPILIGSTGDRMLKLLAKYADAWNTGGGDPEKAKANIAKLNAACEAEGRDPSTVVKTAGIEFAVEGYNEQNAGVLELDDDGKLERLNGLKDLGFDHILLRLKPTTPETILSLKPVVEAFYEGQS